MAILNFGLSSSNYGPSRFGTASTGSSYLSSINRDRSTSRDRGGYGSGYGSNTGSNLYSSRYSSHGTQDTPKGISALASRFGDTKPASSKEPATTTTSAYNAKVTSPTSYSRTRSRDFSSIQSPSSREPTHSLASSTKDDKTLRAGDRYSVRTRTTELPITSSLSTKPEISSQLKSSYTSKPVTNSAYDRSGNISDSRSGYGSDYNKPGYGSSTGGYGSKYSWNQNSYKPSYNRDNSNPASDASNSSGWRSKVYGSETQNRPTTLALDNSSSTKNVNDPKPAVVLKRPSAFQSKLPDKKEDGTEKRSSLPSPNAVKVLPTFNPNDIKLRNKAPADYTSCSETSDDEQDVQEQRVTTPMFPKKIEPAEPVKNRPLRYLNAVPDLPSRKVTSPSQGLVQTPTFKLSDKLSTGKYDITRLTASPSKWLVDKEEQNTKASDPSPTSPLPRRSPPLGCAQTSNVNEDAGMALDCGNKECRKSVLNMSVDPEAQLKLQKQMEEKREEFGRMMKQGYEENTKPTLNNEDIVEAKIGEPSVNNKTIADSKEPYVEAKVEAKVEDKPPLAPHIERTGSKSKMVERKPSKGRGDSLRRSGSFKKTREIRSSQASRSSSSLSSSSDSESEAMSQRSRNGSGNRIRLMKNSSTEINKKGSLNHSESIQSSSNGNLSISESCTINSQSKGENDSHPHLIGTPSGGSSSKLNLPVEGVKKSASRQRSHRMVNGKAAKLSSQEKSSSSSESSEGCLFSIAKSRTMTKPKLLNKKLTIAPMMIISIEALGDRTSPDGKELSRDNSDTNITTNGLDAKPTAIGLPHTFSLALPIKKKPDENVGYQEFQWPAGSPPKIGQSYSIGDDSTADVDTDVEPFQWPSGSPVLKRRNSYFRTQWDTETETEMENWSDSSLPKMKNKMTKLPEETEDELGFEWPSSPEVYRKPSLTSGNEEGAFQWPRSPELKKTNDPKFIGFTTDIDAILNEADMDSFANMEHKMGFTETSSQPPLQEDDESTNGPDTPVEEEESNDEASVKNRARNNLSLFIGQLTNIDEILGNVLQPLTAPIMPEATSKCASTTGDEDDDLPLQEIQASEVKVHDAQAKRAQIGQQIEETEPDETMQRRQAKREELKAEIIKAVKEGLDDATLQIYRDGDYATYLDLEGSLAEQADDIDGLTQSKKNAIILRTQLSVRVHAIIEKLQTSEGRELRRALFSLKQIFQDDKDLVHAFVHHDGLKCLVKVGSSADHNYQTYILRAIGQVMLYVDGMTGISDHPESVEWLYSLVASKFRLVIKTALKLLLVFVEYSEGNAVVLIKAINTFDKSKGNKPWGTLMRILEGKDCPDTELMIYTMNLINKTLNGVPDQDTYYDQSDTLEEQGLENLIQRHMHNPNSDLDLLQQLTIYEAVLAYEDGDDVCRTRTIDPTIRQIPRFCTTDRDDTNRRKSRRHCSSPDLSKEDKRDDGMASSDDERGRVTLMHILNGLPADDLGGIKHSDAGVTPALKRRRERAERQRNFLHDQDILSESRRGSQSSDSASNVEEENRKNAGLSGLDSQSAKMLEVLCGKREGDVKDIASRISALLEKENIINNKKLPINLEIDTSVKDILKKLSTGTILTTAEQEKLKRIGDASGRIQKAKDGLAKDGLAKAQIIQPEAPKTPEPPKKSENDLQWENLKEQLSRPLALGDLDFTDLTEEDDQELFAPPTGGTPPPPPPPPPMFNGGIPPPPPPMENGYNSTIPIAPPPFMNGSDIPPPPPLLISNGIPLAPPIGHSFGINLQPHDDKIQKTKKTIKLFWKEIREDSSRKKRTIWDSLESIDIDTQKLEHLFESRAKDVNTKKIQDQKGVKEIIVLDPKRSNMINIGMTKLPPPRTIKTAILKMDSSIINREGIEKLLLTMLPTAEEKQKIQEAAASNPELPLGSAEQFLMMLSSISELPARLKLWLFKLDYENLEKEVADPLMDIKDGVCHLQKNETFKTIFSILLSVGNFLNATDAKGFHLEYLSKVPEVKDTVNKHSLLHHLCHFVHEKHPGTSDLYSEIGSITRASRVDFDELENTIQKLEVDCKASWDHLKAIAKHDGPTQMKLKMSEFLADCAERIIVLGIIYRRVIKRFRQFLMWMGLAPSTVLESKPQRICSILSEFALEYRTCRERVLQQIQKKANHRERNKTRGKMITEMEKFKPKPKTKEEEADNDLRQLLNYSDVSDTETIRGKNTWRRTRENKARSKEEIILTDGLDDALLDSLVKTATQTPTTRSTPRERKRSRHADRKSLKRSRTRDRTVISELESLQALAEKRE